MLPYFKYTEDVQNFCHLMEYSIDLSGRKYEYVCMYTLDEFTPPVITPYNLCPSFSPLIPPEKVIPYLTLVLNGYTLEEAVKELGVVWDNPLSIT